MTKTLNPEYKDVEGRAGCSALLALAIWPFFEGYFFMLAVGIIHSWWNHVPTMGFWTAFLVALFLGFVISPKTIKKPLERYLEAKAKRGDI